MGVSRRAQRGGLDAHPRRSSSTIAQAPVFTMHLPKGPRALPNLYGAWHHPPHPI